MLTNKDKLRAIYVLRNKLGMGHDEIQRVVAIAATIESVYMFTFSRNHDDLSKTMLEQPLFDRMRLEETEEISYLENPPQVEEGAITCKCGSSRVYSFSKQTRSGDESTTVFAMCCACNSKWVV